MATLTTVDASVLQELQSREQFFWLDLANPDPEEIDALGEILGLHKLAIEDTQEFGQRPKADAYGDELLLVYCGRSPLTTGTSAITSPGPGMTSTRRGTPSRGCSRPTATRSRNV
jgi:CorA-like Mg2+ transporter protein